MAKATIRPEGRNPISVLFDPNTYRLEKANQIAEIGIPGLAAPILQYVRGNGRTLSMDLFFDTYEQRVNVAAYTDQIYGLLDSDPKLRRPPICTFTWGGFTFRGVLERVGGTFTLFLPNGTPVRATLSVSFKEFVEVDVQVNLAPAQLVNVARTHVIQSGDTLSAIAGAVYGDPQRWAAIATANNIVDPRNLQPGQVLVIPP